MFLLQDSELTELKDTIEVLRVKNTEAQEIIHGALAAPEMEPPGTEHFVDVQKAPNASKGRNFKSFRLTNERLSLFVLVFSTADQSAELV